MNTELRKMMVKAEGRFLRPEEEERTRAWAKGIRTRIELHNRIRAAEDAIVDAASTAFVELHGEMAEQIPHFRDKVGRDYRLFLRYVAHCVVRDDVEFFRRAYAEWIADLLSGMTEADVLKSGYEVLKVALQEQLEPSDARTVLPYVDLFLQELGKYA